MKKAAILLDDSSLSVSDIAINCGFDNISYFIRKFKEYQGITPKKYRSRKMPE
nr:helix-turn-helix transcriptional regulator [uncultured Dorea sp.]